MRTDRVRASGTLGSPKWKSKPLIKQTQPAKPILAMEAMRRSSHHVAGMKKAESNKAQSESMLNVSDITLPRSSSTPQPPESVTKSFGTRLDLRGGLDQELAFILIHGFKSELTLAVLQKPDTKVVNSSRFHH